MIRTRGFGEVGETARTMIRISHESAGVMLDYAVRAQELNTTLAQRAVETWIDALRRQTALGQDATREIFEKAEEQSDALRSFYGQWTGVLWSFPGALYGPVGHVAVPHPPAAGLADRDRARAAGHRAAAPGRPGAGAAQRPDAG